MRLQVDHKLQKCIVKKDTCRPKTKNLVYNLEVNLINFVKFCKKEL